MDLQTNGRNVTSGYDPGRGEDFTAYAVVDEGGLIVDARPFPWSLDDYREIVRGQIIGEPLPRLEERIRSLWTLGIPPENAAGALYDGRDD